MVHWVLLHCHHRRLKRIHILMLGIRWLLHAISGIPTEKAWVILLPSPKHTPHLYRNIKNVLQESLIINNLLNRLFAYILTNTLSTTPNIKAIFLVHFLGSLPHVGENPKYHFLKRQGLYMENDLATPCSYPVPVNTLTPRALSDGHSQGRLWWRCSGHGSSGRGRGSSRCGSSRGGTGSSGSSGSSIFFLRFFHSFWLIVIIKSIK